MRKNILFYYNFLFCLPDLAVHGRGNLCLYVCVSKKLFVHDAFSSYTNVIKLDINKFTPFLRGHQTNLHMLSCLLEESTMYIVFVIRNAMQSFNCSLSKILLLIFFSISLNREFEADISVVYFYKIKTSFDYLWQSFPRNY